MRALAYVLQLALLATHQADAAYQHEWRPLGVPGDIEGFLAFNLVAVGALAWGAVQVGRTGSRAWTVACAATGVITGLVHGVLWLQGGVEFTGVASRAVLGAIVLLAMLQLAELWRSEPPATR
jgi:hypothetical protein